MTRTIILGTALVIGVFAQEPPSEQRHVRVAGQTFEFIGGQMLGGAPVRGQPYSAEAVTESTQTLADGSHIVNRSSSMIYRDAEGRERREQSIGKLGSWNAEGEPATIVFISDPVAKTNYSLNPKDHTAQKMPSIVGAAKLSASMAFGGGRGAISLEASNTSVDAGPEGHIFVERQVTTPGGATPKSEDLGAQTIEGVTAQGTRTTVTIPAGQIGNDREINIVSERWFSPELQVVVRSKRSDPRVGDVEYKLTNINRSEPLHSMFEVPADYTISAPKNVHYEFNEKQQDQ